MGRPFVLIPLVLELYRPRAHSYRQVSTSFTHVKTWNLANYSAQKFTFSELAWAVSIKIHFQFVTDFHLYLVHGLDPKHRTNLCLGLLFFWKLNRHLSLLLPLTDFFHNCSSIKHHPFFHALLPASLFCWRKASPQHDAATANSRIMVVACVC